MSETVEVKVQLPKTVYNVLVELCKLEKISLEEHLKRSIIGDLEADANSGFSGYMDNLAEEVTAILKAINPGENE
jgi:hypothetical protein